MAYLSRLVVSNFRNLQQLDQALPPGVLVFVGDNAQGKTSLLEAVYLLAIARSFRAENEREVVNFQTGLGGGQALVGGTINKPGERVQIYIGFQAAPITGKDANPDGSAGLGYSARKQIRVSRVRRTAAELVGMVNAVLFSADDIELTLGPPAARRRYLDILISQANPLYLKALQRYQRVLQQRNQLLKTLREGGAKEGELAFWDDELIREGAWLIWQRRETMQYLSLLCAQHHRELGGPKEDFQMQYVPRVTPGNDLAATEENFRQAMSRLTQRERATATTAAGPHRDDFKLLVNGIDMGIFASRGQARTIALSLRLAEAAYLASAREDGPIVLLDDVLSEMDAERRRRVLEKLSQYQQVLITTTDLELVQDFFGPSATYYQVENGNVTLLNSQTHQATSNKQDS